MPTLRFSRCPASYVGLLNLCVSDVEQRVKVTGDAPMRLIRIMISRLRFRLPPQITKAMRTLHRMALIRTADGVGAVRLINAKTKSGSD
jgi:hypothetical protein